MYITSEQLQGKEKCNEPLTGSESFQMELIRDGSIHVSLARGPYLATSQFKGMGYFALLQGLSICKQLYRLPVLAF